jgi:hypothetical protein
MTLCTFSRRVSNEIMRIRCISQLPKSCMYLANSCFVHVAPRWCTMLNLDLSILGFLCHPVENQNQGLPLYLLLAPRSAATSLKHFDAGPIRTSLLFWTTPHHRDAKSIITGMCWHVLAPAYTWMLLHKCWCILMLSQICSFRMDPSSWCGTYVEAYHVCILFLKHFLHLESKKIQNCWDAICSWRQPTSTFGAEGSLKRSWRIKCISQLPKSCMFLAKSCFVHVAPRWCTMLNLESINAWILMSSNRKPK